MTKKDFEIIALLCHRIILMEKKNMFTSVGIISMIIDELKIAYPKFNEDKFRAFSILGK